MSEPLQMGVGRPRQKPWAGAGLFNGLAAICCVLSAACSDEGTYLLVDSEVAGLTRLEVSAYASAGVVVQGARLDRGGRELELPARVEISDSGRTDVLRFFVWGVDGETDLAFGAVTIDLKTETGGDVPILLGPIDDDCDGDRIPDAEDGCREIANVEQIDADGDGMDDACQPGRGCASNLLVNGSLDWGTGGWRQSPISTFEARPNGQGQSPGYGEICKIATGIPESYDVEVVDAVDDVVAGASYRLDGWVRSNSAVAQTIEAELRERDADGNTGAVTLTQVTPNSEWQLLTTLITTEATGSAIKVKFESNGGLDGTCFDLDSACLVQVHTCSSDL